MNPVLRFFKTGPDKAVQGDTAETDRRYRRLRATILITLTASYAIAYTCRLGLSVVKKPLIDGNIFSAEQLGTIGSALFYTYAFGKLVNGFLADHANIRRFLSAGVLVSALINIAMGWAPVFWFWVILWGLNGWFQSFGAPGGVVSLSQWFSNRERGRSYGFWSTAHSMGEGMTFLLSSSAVMAFGWRAGFVGPGAVCVALSFAMYALLRDRPRALGLPAVADWRHDHPAAPVAGVADPGPTSVRPATVTPVSTWQAQLSILKMPQIWVLAVSSALMYVTRYGMNSWGMLYLQEEKGYSGLEAGGLLALNTAAGFAGCVGYGFISDKLFQARRPPANLLCGLLDVAALSALFFGPAGHPALVVAAFLVHGFAINGLITSLGGLFAVDLASKQASGAVMGFIGVFSYLGAALQERISGVLIQRGITMTGGGRHYDFGGAVAFWLGASVLSMLLAATLWRCHATD